MKPAPRRFFCNACKKQVRSSERQYHFASKAHREARAADQDGREVERPTIADDDGEPS